MSHSTRNMIVVCSVLLANTATLSLASESADRVAERIPSYQFPCQALGRPVDYSVYVPQGNAPEGGWPMMMMLHGLGRHHRSLVDDAKCRERIVRQPFVIVFADGRRGWYLDSPVDPKSHYQSMLLELLQHARKTLPVSSQAEKTAVGGWSMGGYGAMRFAQAYPDQVKVVSTMIGLLDFPNAKLPKQQNHSVPPLFGAPTNWPQLNCMNAAKRLRGNSIQILSATDAFDTTMNRTFHARLEAEGLPHSFEELPGGHDFPTVRMMLTRSMKFVARQFDGSSVKSAVDNANQ